MLTLLAAVVLTQQTSPEPPLKLKVGDSWTAEYSYHYKGDDIDQTQIEVTNYSVVREGKRDLLVVQWKLQETRMDGEKIPAPPGTKPVVKKITLDGEALDSQINEDVVRYRIERILQVERKGLQEPAFFPPPPTVRLVGIKRVAQLDPRVKDDSVVTYSITEEGGDRPMNASGYYSFHKTTGIAQNGHWTIANCPIPGGESLCELEVKLKVKDLKLAPRQ